MSIPSLSLTGQVALVTGARRGIGEACALVFAEAGADVAICDWATDQGELEQVAAKVRALGREALTMKVDAKNQEHVADFVARAMERFGRIDILVNNAGVHDGGFSPEPEHYNQERYREEAAKRAQLLENSALILYQNDEAWEKVFQNNVMSCLVCSRAVAPAMMKQMSGSIVNMASVRAVHRGRLALSSYAVSKRAVVMITEGLAADLGRYRVRVNAIGPGSVRTEMLRSTFSDPERLNALTQRMVLSGELLRPEDIAYTALFLSSDLGKYVTGQFILVDAGQTTLHT